MWAGYGTKSYPVWKWADINRECPTFLCHILGVGYAGTLQSVPGVPLH